MTDDPDLRHSQDRQRISLRRPDQIAYWTQALGVSREELVEAVQKAGGHPADVREVLATRRH